MSLPGNESEPDLLLLERFRRGEREAFDGIVARYRRDVYRIARRMTGNHDDADDVAQETFLRAYRSLARFRGDATLRTWLFRIALNLTINLGRSKSQRRPEKKDLERMADPTAPRGQDGELRLIVDERGRQVRAAVGRLAPRQRQVVILRIYEEMKFTEIATLLESPVGTVKANFFHAMNNLRKTLT